ncbi:hypothetical protein HPB48_022568 [Haemaphysalis longicornis]|uniref:Uncharacterized protein n=1 Tax=Haemaphysalis longicornis TaxID=44386 RepID=A0A9J6H4T6_HAELO|nr:hypothetical protein HPB48_022568 [Haemaphysalis longicornis]
MRNNGPLMSTSRQRKSCCELEPAALTWLESSTYKENLKGLNSVRFRNPFSDHHIHLDVGCGPENFQQEHLLLDYVPAGESCPWTTPRTCWNTPQGIVTNLKSRSKLWT